MTVSRVACPSRAWITCTGVLLFKCSEAKTRRQSCGCNTNGLGGQTARMTRALQQIGRTRERERFVVIPLIAERDGCRSIKLFHSPDDLGDDSPQAIPNGNNPRTVILGWFDVKQVIHSTVGHFSFEDIQSRQFTGFLHAQPTLNEQLQ